MRRIFRFSLGCALVVLLAGLCGCGGSSKLTPVRGKLVKDGQPFQAQLTDPRYPSGEGIGLATVQFFPVTDEKMSLLDKNGDVIAIGGVRNATVKADGTFFFEGKLNEGVPPGTYRIIIKQIDPLTERDHLENRFNERNSKITRTITTGSQEEIVIDVGKPAS